MGGRSSRSEISRCGFAMSRPRVRSGLDCEREREREREREESIWHGQRKPWTIISGSRDSAIYKSTDGGEHWSKLATGLPSELVGRSNVAISAASPDRVYALIEAKPGSGLYRSDDAGATWKLVNG